MLILFQVLVVIASPAVVKSQNEESVPLTSEDFQQIRNLSPDVATVVARQSVAGQNIAGCRLVHQCRRCVAQPHVVIEDVFEDKCDDRRTKDKSTHVKNCRATTRVIPFQKNVKICHHSMEEICETPCASCPEFCQPNKQFWCEDDYEVRKTNEILRIRFCYFIAYSV